MILTHFLKQLPSCNKCCKIFLDPKFLSAKTWSTEQLLNKTSSYVEHLCDGSKKMLKIARSLMLCQVWYFSFLFFWYIFFNSEISLCCNSILLLFIVKYCTFSTTEHWRNWISPNNYKQVYVQCWLTNPTFTF